MCGRYTLTAPIEEILEHYSLGSSVLSLKERYNISPSQDVPVIRLADETTQRTLNMMHWGLIPSWAKDKKIGYKMTNAKAETLNEKPSYRTAFKKRHCLIPATGFYEWAVTENRKQPFYIHRKDNAFFSFAGLWGHWTGDEGIFSCTIITTEPNDVLKPIHNRMPVIIDSSNYSMWLDNAITPEALQSLLRLAPSDALEAYPVSTLVNRPKNNSPDCIAPVH